MYAMSVLFIFRVTHTAVQLWSAEWGSYWGGGGGGVRRNNQQGNHSQLCSCTAWLARSQVSPKRGLAHPFSSPPSFLSKASCALPLQLPKATGEKKEERQKRGQLFLEQQRERYKKITFKDVQRAGFTDGSLWSAREVIYFQPAVTQREDALFFRRMRRQKSASVNKAGASEL